MSNSKNFNFSLNSVPTELVGDENGFFVKLPVYGDLLAKEYQALEALERQETVWMGKLLDLATTLAERSNFDVWEVIGKLENLDAMTNQEKSELMGDLMPRLVKLESEKVAVEDRLTNTALVVLQSRISSGITMGDVLEFPQNFLKQINDFVAKEQAEGTNISYTSLRNNYDILLGKAALGEQLIMAYEDALHNPNDESLMKTVETAKTSYWEYEQTTKKLGL